MMTKLDQREQTALLEDKPVPPADLQVREHLDIVLASDEFCPSRRASELLQHLVERALNGDAASLKERLLGVDIFHRRSDYDTSTDAIVRVTANDVRRRLAQFYSRHPVQPLRISLPLGSYIPDFVAVTVSTPQASRAGSGLVSNGALPHTELLPATGIEHSPTPEIAAPARVRVLPGLPYALGLVLAVLLGWWSRLLVDEHGAQTNNSYTFYNDLLGPIGLNGSGGTEIALTNPHVLLYHGLDSPGPALGVIPNDIPVPADMAAELNKSANDTQADFPYHHFFVDSTNYTGIGESKAAFGLARTFQATGRNAGLTEERFLNWETARLDQLVILGAPHESKFVQETLSAANFTIGYDSIHNAHPLPGERAEYSRLRSDDVLQDYGLIWMTRSPSGTRILVLAGLTSAGTAGVGEFFSDPQRMWPVYQQLRAAAGSRGFPDSWQVLVRIQARQDVPVSVTPIAVRITRAQLE
jgi:hypothetical protein